MARDLPERDLLGSRQGFGGLATGSATDPNAGPLFILLACALCTTLPDPAPTSTAWHESRLEPVAHG